MRFGGIQIQRDFALQPDLITFPIPQFLGQAAVPSTVDLYVDGLRRYSGETPAGPFQLGTVPIVNGAGNAQVVVTDALGRQSTFDFPFYTTSQLLKPGLDDYSVDFGFVRQHYGIESFDYSSDPTASAVYRRGMTDWLTVETHAEGISGVANAGAGGVVRIGDGGVLTGSVAESRGSHADGHQAGLGYSWRNTWFNFALDSPAQLRRLPRRRLEIRTAAADTHRSRARRRHLGVGSAASARITSSSRIPASRVRVLRARFISNRSARAFR